MPEAQLLSPRLFGEDRNGKQRRAVARAVEAAPARNHLEACTHLSHVFADNPTFVLLPRFSRLADAGMAAMDLIARPLQNTSQIALADVAARPEAGPICEELMAAAQEWLQDAPMQPRHIETAHRFARTIPSARPAECLAALLQHHKQYGGGLRWFDLRDGWVEPRTPWRAGSSRYRFRLWSLCRLAAQCGVLHGMPGALLGDDEAGEDETAEADNG